MDEHEKDEKALAAEIWYCRTTAVSLLTLAMTMAAGAVWFLFRNVWLAVGCAGSALFSYVLSRVCARRANRLIHPESDPP